MTTRVCPECGCDTWAASQSKELSAAVGRHMASGRKQAIENLELRLRVAELEDQEHYRQRKVRAQAKVIRRLEDKLRSHGSYPHANVRPWEASSVPQEFPITPADSGDAA